MLYIGETGRRLRDHFRKHLTDVKKNDRDASKPVLKDFNLPGHSLNNMSVCGLSLHQGNTESRKNSEQKFIFKIATLVPGSTKFIIPLIYPRTIHCYDPTNNIASFSNV